MRYEMGIREVSLHFASSFFNVTSLQEPLPYWHVYNFNAINTLNKFMWLRMEFTHGQVNRRQALYCQ